MIAADPTTNLNHIDTSRVTDMSELFKNYTNFNGNISKWNTSSVENMSEMFYSAQAFNQPIGEWDTSSVTNMKTMMYAAGVFNQDLTRWVQWKDPTDASITTATKGMFGLQYVMARSNKAPWMPK